MIGDLKPYPAMKDSGVEWLGEMPEHWEVRRNGRLFVQRKETGFADLPILEVSLKTGVRIRDFENSNRKQVMSDRDKYKRAAAGDIAYNMMRMWQGAVGVAPEDGLVSPAYVVAKPLPGTEPRFYMQLFRTDSYMTEVDKYSRGIVKDRNRLYWEDFKRMPSCFPPLPEQAAIVRYVDHVDRRVRRLVRAKRKLIALLTEQKQAIIHQAVTRGLDPDVPLKDSGVEWLGEVPAHWEVRRSKRVFTPRKELARPGDIQLAATQAYGVIAQEEYERKVGRKVVKIFRNLEKRSHVEVDDFVISMRSFQGGLERAWVSGCIRSSYIVLRPTIAVDIDFFSYLFKSRSYVGALQSTANFIRDGQDLNFDNFCRVDLPLPPIEEQQKIAKVLNEAVSSGTKFAERAQAEIDLLKEYRVRLIADVVTGKLDVREAMLSEQTASAVRPSAKKANIHFRRAVFGAEIVHRLHREPTFGHVKFEKLVFLCEKQCGIDTGSHYYRQAAGPYDNRALRSIDSQMKKQKWYEARKGEKSYRYIPLEKAGNHKQYFDRYFADTAERFDEIIKIFRRLNTERCEIVATLYSAWEDLLRQGQVTDEQIIYEVRHNWHQSKKRIPEKRWHKALEWMREKSLVPEKAEA